MTKAMTLMTIATGRAGPVFWGLTLGVGSSPSANLRAASRLIVTPATVVEVRADSGIAGGIGVGPAGLTLTPAKVGAETGLDEAMPSTLGAAGLNV